MVDVIHIVSEHFSPFGHKALCGVHLAAHDRWITQEEANDEDENHVFTCGQCWLALSGKEPMSRD